MARKALELASLLALGTIGVLPTAFGQASEHFRPHVACQTLASTSPEQRSRLEGGEILTELHTDDEHRRGIGIARIHLDAPAELIAAVVGDPTGFPSFLPYVSESQVEELDDGRLLNRQRLDLPFPLRNRHFEIRIEQRDSQVAGRTCLESRWRYVEGSGNIKSNVGRWEILALDAEASALAYVVDADPGGLLPRWIKRWVTRRALPTIAEGVAEEVRRRQRQRR